MKRSSSRAPADTVRRRLISILLLSALVLAAGWALKFPCSAPTSDAESANYCYTDISILYRDRHIEAGGWPYIGGELEDGRLAGNALEYPVLTGVVMYAAGHLVSGMRSYFNVTALLLLPAGLAVAYLLTLLAGRRALLWALAPSLALYAFHNWDLLAVVAVVAGIWCWSRDRPWWAACLFGVGAGFKLYPVLLLAPLALHLLARKGRGPALGALACGLGTLLAVNLPFAIADPEGWWATYAYHSERISNLDSVWTWVPGVYSLTPERLNLMTTVMTAVSSAAILAYAWTRGRRTGDFPFLASSAALVAAFLLWNKVQSPQYALWLLPFFVLLRVKLWWWVAYEVADLLVYFSFFSLFSPGVTSAAGVYDVALDLLIYGVWLRALVHLALIVVFLRTPEERERTMLQPARPPFQEAAMSEA